MAPPGVEVDHVLAFLDAIDTVASAFGPVKGAVAATKYLIELVKVLRSSSSATTGTNFDGLHSEFMLERRSGPTSFSMLLE